MATLANASSWWVAKQNSGGNLTDQGANGRTMSNIGGPSFLNDGTYYYAQLRSSIGYAFSASDAADLDADTGDFTVLVVYTPRVDLTGTKILWSKWPSGSPGYQLGTSGATPTATAKEGAGTVSATGSSLSVGTRYTVALVRSSGQIRVVVDGTAGAAVTADDDLANTDPARIGRTSSGVTGNWADADLYGVAWFKGTALTNSECTSVGAELLAADTVANPVGKDLDLRWNVAGPVGKDLDLRWSVAGPVGKNLDLRWSVAGPVGTFQVRTEVAWTTDPLTRPGALAWSTLPTISGTVRGIRDLNIRRGTKVLSSSVEAGTAVCKADNSDRQLDPSNTASALWPNVKPRKRIRFIVNAGSTEVVLFTGFVERWPIEWMLETGWVTISASDLVNIIAGLRLPPSVLDVVMREAGPVGYWPMTETVFNQQADDVVGTHDGQFTGTVQTGQQMIPYDARPNPKFVQDTNEIALTAMYATRPSYSDEITLLVWFAQPPVDAGGLFNPVIMELVAQSTPWTSPGGGSPTTTPAGILVAIDPAGTAGRHVIAVRVSDGTNVARVSSIVAYKLYDGVAHMASVTIKGSTKSVKGAFNGDDPVTLNDVGSPYTALSSVNVATAMSSAQIIAAGWGIQVQTLPTVALEGVVGHLAIFDRLLTEPELTAIYEAGTIAWDGDTTGERLERILDLVGVDTGDRDIDTGTQTCGPTILGSQNALAYIKKLVATEQGVCFVSGDGKLTFTDRLPDSPSIVQVFSDDLTADPTGAPMGPVSPDYSWDRIVNHLGVSRENGADQTIENTASVTAYGPLSGATGGKVDTLHQTADDARATGTRLTDRYAEPRVYIPGVTLEANDDSVTLDTMTGVELGDATTTKVRPAGGGSAIVQTGIVESVEHRLPGSNVWTVTYGLVDYPEP